MNLMIPLIGMALAAAALGGEMRTEFVTLSLGKGMGPYFYRNGGKIMELTASSRGIGAPISYEGDDVLFLYEDPEDMAKRPDDGMAPKPVAQVKLPGGQDRVLVMFSDTGHSGGGLTLHATGISTKAMKAGDYRLFNMSKSQVLTVMNKQKAAIAPGSVADISDASWKSGTIDMQVQLGVTDGGEPRRVYSSIWGHRPGRRSFIFIFDRPDKFRPIEIRCFYDVPPAKISE